MVVLVLDMLLAVGGKRSPLQHVKLLRLFQLGASPYCSPSRGPRYRLERHRLSYSVVRFPSMCTAPKQLRQTGASILTYRTYGCLLSQEHIKYVLSLGSNM
jgi:hypothetical protein